MTIGISQSEKIRKHGRNGRSKQAGTRSGRTCNVKANAAKTATAAEDFAFQETFRLFLKTGCAQERALPIKAFLRKNGLKDHLNRSADFQNPVP